MQIQINLHSGESSTPPPPPSSVLPTPQYEPPPPYGGRTPLSFPGYIPNGTTEELRRLDNQNTSTFGSDAFTFKSDFCRSQKTWLQNYTV